MYANIYTFENRCNMPSYMYFVLLLVLAIGFSLLFQDFRLEAMQVMERMDTQTDGAASAPNTASPPANAASTTATAPATAPVATASTVRNAPLQKPRVESAVYV
jgi:zona occludens toxin (predicted ATPase)